MTILCRVYDIVDKNGGYDEGHVTQEKKVV